jgi:hypothetical protein
MNRIAKILLFFFSLLVFYKGQAAPIIRDTVPNVVPQYFGAPFYQFAKYIVVDSFVMTKAGDTSDIPRYPALEFKSSDNRWYGHDRTRWQRFLFPGDTISLSNRINLKLNISDTTAMLLPYLRKVDTAAMLANYINLTGYGIIRSGQAIRADTGATGLATQHDLTQIAVSASNGIINNSNVIQLGDLSSTSTATLTTDRYLRGGNRSIYLMGNKTNEGVANLIFKDTLLATPGNSKVKTWMEFHSLDHVTPPFIIGTSSVDDGTGFNNHVMNWGFNLSPAGTRVNPSYGAMGISMEGAFQDLQEFHIFWIGLDNLQRRALSITADTTNKTIDAYFQATSFELKDVDAGQEVWAQFTGGNGGTATNFHLYSGSTNQYNLQYGFSVSGGNTGASFSTTGPGVATFRIDNSGGWDEFYAPTFTSRNTYNEFTAQVLPATDGNRFLGSPSQRWQNVDAIYHRATNGMLIGDYSANNLPNTAFDITAAGSANGHIHIQSTTNSNAGIVIENANAGNSLLQLKASTSNGVVPFIALADQDDANNGAGLALERNTSPLLNGAVNDFLIRNVTDNKAILFGTRISGTLAERMRVNNTGDLQIGSTIDLGSSKLQVTGTIQMQDANQGSGKVLTSDANGVGTWQTPSATLYSGDGFLAGNRVVTGAGNSLTFTSTRTGLNATMNINNTSSGAGLIVSAAGSGTGIEAGSATGYGGNIFSTSGPGLQVSSQSNTGLIVSSTTGVPAEIQTIPASTNTTVPIISLYRKTSGTAAANIAGSVDLHNENGGGTDVLSTRIVSKLTTVTAAAEVSQFEIWGLNSGSLSQLFTVAGNANATFGTTNSIVGVATNNDAVAGNIGEEVNSTVSTYTNFTTTATYQNITSITLTAGDWDISAFFTYSANSATITAAANAIYVISTTTASAVGATEGKNIAYVPQAAMLGSSLLSESIAPYRVSLSGTTTFYLNAQATFTAGNPQFVGTLRARRMR